MEILQRIRQTLSIFSFFIQSNPSFILLIYTLLFPLCNNLSQNSLHCPFPLNCILRAHHSFFFFFLFLPF
ncbi:unnamed protein product [Meloidogyne enterolobii]|uniref:Uncharacterized protein n=1 Tax=Meloidogyne enterolobii TaxID=390850 RepID=A0ACB0XLS4_MELEN